MPPTRTARPPIPIETRKRPSKAGRRKMIPTDSIPSNAAWGVTRSRRCSIHSQASLDILCSRRDKQVPQGVVLLLDGPVGSHLAADFVPFVVLVLVIIVRVRSEGPRRPVEGIADRVAPIRGAAAPNAGEDKNEAQSQRPAVHRCLARPGPPTHARSSPVIMDMEKRTGRGDREGVWRDPDSPRWAFPRKDQLGPSRNPQKAA